MDRETIIKLAQEAGGRVMQPYDYGDTPDRMIMMYGSLEKFAQLVAAHEREECAKLSDMLGEMLAKDHPVHARVALTIGIKIRART